MTSRFRHNGIYLMLSDEELELLNEKYKASKCKTLRQFIMKCILEKDIYVLDMDVFREMSTNISRTSNNINQIAKRINTTSIIYKDDVEDLKILSTIILPIGHKRFIRLLLTILIKDECTNGTPSTSVRYGEK